MKRRDGLIGRKSAKQVGLAQIVHKKRGRLITLKYYILRSQQVSRGTQKAGLHILVLNTQPKACLLQDAALAF